MTPLVSIIIPIKEIESERLLLLLSSVRFLKKNHSIELIIIYSENSPESLLTNNGIELESYKLFYLKPNGIYNAFNFGVLKATGNWIMFFGGDDLILPSFNDLLIDLDSNSKYKFGEFSVIVCNVVFGYNKIFKPIKSKYGLIFRNWCQQGVLYNRNIFSKHSFDENYFIQADHKFNIELSVNPLFKICYLNKVISFFNTNGVSQTTIDKKFRSDFPKIIQTNFGSLLGLFTYFKREIANYVKKY